MRRAVLALVLVAALAPARARASDAGAMVIELASRAPAVERPASAADAPGFGAAGEAVGSPAVALDASAARVESLHVWATARGAWAAVLGHASRADREAAAWAGRALLDACAAGVARADELLAAEAAGAAGVDDDALDRAALLREVVLPLRAAEGLLWAASARSGAERVAIASRSGEIAGAVAPVSAWSRAARGLVLASAAVLSAGGALGAPGEEIGALLAAVGRDTDELPGFAGPLAALRVRVGAVEPDESLVRGVAERVGVSAGFGAGLLAGLLVADAADVVFDALAEERGGASRAALAARSTDLYGALLAGGGAGVGGADGGERSWAGAAVRARVRLATPTGLDASVMPALYALAHAEVVGPGAAIALLRSAGEGRGGGDPFALEAALALARLLSARGGAGDAALGAERLLRAVDGASDAREASRAALLAAALAREAGDAGLLRRAVRAAHELGGMSAEIDAARVALVTLAARDAGVPGAELAEVLGSIGDADRRAEARRAWLESWAARLIAAAAGGAIGAAERGAAEELRALAGEGGGDGSAFRALAAAGWALGDDVAAHDAAQRAVAWEGTGPAWVGAVGAASAAMLGGAAWRASLSEGGAGAEALRGAGALVTARLAEEVTASSVTHLALRGGVGGGSAVAGEALARVEGALWERGERAEGVARTALRAALAGGGADGAAGDAVAACARRWSASGGPRDVTLLAGEVLLRGGDDASAFAAFRRVGSAGDGPRDAGWWHAWSRMLEVLDRIDADGSRASAIAREWARLRSLGVPDSGEAGMWGDRLRALASRRGLGGS